MVDPRTPVVVGVGQAQQRPADLAEAEEPIELLAGAARAALADARARRSLVAALDTVAVVEMVSWRYPDPGALLARRLGARHVRTTAMTTVGGNSPQLLLGTLAVDIAAGRADAVLLGGAECLFTRRRARREPKTWLDWTQADDPPCARVIGDTRPGTNDYEDAHAAVAPTHIYPLFETALRASAGHDVDEHQVCVSELWSTFAATAATNPHAWSRMAYSPEQIRMVEPHNRMITFPYPKRMCANIQVDQAAAVVMCSLDRARALGVREDRLVFPLASADAHDHWHFSERDRLDDSPAIRAAAHVALSSVGLGVDDVARFDLYSCFPSAVEIAMAALGLAGPAGGDQRPLTVTGGLGFAGGPANDYPMHAIAAMVEACRLEPDSVGYVGTLGWYATKHSIGLYSTRPPEQGFRRIDPAVAQAAVDALPRRSPAGTYTGNASVEATAVVFDRDGAPSLAIVTGITPDGRRVLANSHDPDTMLAMTKEPWEGRTVAVRTDGTTNRVG